MMTFHAARWALSRIALSLALAGRASNATAKRPDLTDLDDFRRAAATALDRVGRFDNEEVVLEWWRPGGKAGFGFYGDKAFAFEAVTCGPSQEFHIVAKMNDQAQFNL